MTTGSTLYLILCIAVFATFGIVLAYATWQQARLGGDFATTPGRNPPAHPATKAQAHA
ncbi:MAG TPA: hypothetical protein VE690_05555 [Rhodopila sp.]|nr:hypothetical protein [Rhodopila sp.]